MFLSFIANCVMLNVTDAGAEDRFCSTWIYVAYEFAIKYTCPFRIHDLPQDFWQQWHDGCHEWNMNYYPYGVPEVTPVLNRVSVAQYLVFSVMFCRSLFVLFLLTIVLSILISKVSVYPFDVVKRFFIRAYVLKVWLNINFKWVVLFFIVCLIY